MDATNYSSRTFGSGRRQALTPLFWICGVAQAGCTVALFTQDDPIIAIAVFFTLLFGVAIVIEPRSSFLAISFVTFMIHSDVISKGYVVNILGVNWYSMDWILFFSLLSMTLFFCLGRTYPLPKTALTVPLVAFLFLLPVSAYCGIEHGNQLRDVFADFRLFFYYVSFFLVLAFVKTEKDLEYVFWSTIICGLIGALPEIISSLSVSTTDTMTGQRLPFGRITGWHEVNYPIQLVGSIAMLPFVPSFQKRLLLVLSASVSCLAMALSYARGSWLAAAFGIAVLLLLMVLFAPSLRRGILGILGASILAFSALFLLDTLDIFSFKVLTSRASLVSTQQIDISSLARLSEWQEAFSVFLKSPIFGAGLGYIFHFYAVGIGNISQIYVHNSYIYVLSKMGIVGLVVFLFLFSYALSLGYQTLKKTAGATRMGLVLSFVSMLCVLLAKSLTTWHLNTITTSIYVGVILGALAITHTWSREGQ